MSNLILKQVVGASKEEAAAKGTFNFDLKYDATKAYQSALKKDPVLNLQEFAKEFLSKKVKDVAGVGCFVTLEPSVVNSRIRPYSVDTVVTTGKRKWKMAYQLVDTDTKQILAIVDDKANAEALVKTIITESEGTIKNVEGQVIKVVTEGENLAFTATYTPTIGTRDGSYIVFGYSVG